MSYVGLDIAKSTFVVCIRTSKKSTTRKFINKKSGFSDLMQWISTFNVNKPHFCMESTGKYGFALAEYLYGNKEKVSIVNPFKIKHFSKSLMLRNKSDEIDAGLIAQFCQTHSPKLWKPKPANIQRLTELVRRLSQLESLKRQDKNRIENENNKDIIKSIKFIGDKLKKEIDNIVNLIDQLLKNDKELSNKTKLLKSISGVGNKTIYTMLTCLGEPEQFKSAKQFASYIGINPSYKQSGTSLNQSFLSKIGDSRLRKSLYMPTLCAIVHNPVIKAFYQRLIAAGKPKMVAVCAAMRKLAFIIFGVLKSKMKFDPTYAMK